MLALTPLLLGWTTTVPPPTRRCDGVGRAAITVPQPRRNAAVSRTAVSTHTPHRCAAPTCQLLLGLDDMGDFDPFAADYPPATCDSKKTRVKFCTTAGDTHVNVDRALSPEGVDRFLELVEGGHFTDMLLYRVLPGFLVQFGASAASAQWEDKALPDEPNRFTFRGGTLSFAGSGGPNSRTCHLFVALSPKGAELGGAAHEATLGHFEDVGIFEAVARNFEASGYPDLGELQAKLVEGGNDAAAEYPKLDRILSAEVVE